MFVGGFQEAHENAAYFPEDKPEAFALLIERVYKDSYQEVPEYASLPVVRGMPSSEIGGVCSYRQVVHARSRRLYDDLLPLSICTSQDQL